MSSPSLEKGLILNSRRKAVKLHGLPLLLLSVQGLGVIYSDIGTSPLYVLNGIWPAAGPTPPPEDVVGGISTIIWSIMLLPLVKYVVLSLYFGTREGEGGSFALFQGLFPPTHTDVETDRTLTGDTLGSDAPSIRTGTRRISQKVRWPLMILCLLGTSLTMADGIFTPAVSVTSAVGGIAVAKPNVIKDITPISIALLLGLFAVQRFGTGRIAFTFGPISFIWFALLAGTGIYNITFYPAIFRAFDPSRAVLLFVRTKNYGLLSGVLLALTGCEAVFANLGQFNVASIRISFCCVVFPSLILAYLGQGARLVVDGDAVMSNLFYNTIPGEANGPLFWIIFVFAILATIIASQALTTATFSLVQQLINSNALPPLRMVQTSEKLQGQIYIPAANWTLMVATIVAVAVFSNLANLTNAYGFAVSTVMFSTSVMLAIHIFYIKKLPLVVALAYFLSFGFFDALFWGAALQKVPHGAWVPLVIGVVLVMIMTLWTWAKSLEDRFDGDNLRDLRYFIQQEHAYHADSESSSLVVKDTESDSTFYYLPNFGERTETGIVIGERRRIQRIPSCAIFHKASKGKGVPHTFIGFLRRWPALPRVVIFLSVRVVPIARVSPQERYAVSKVRTVEGFYGVTYFVGFRDDFDIQVDDVIETICDIEIISNPKECASIIKDIRFAAKNSTHIAPRYHVVSKKIDGGSVFTVIRNWVRAYLIQDIYFRLATMFPVTRRWLTSADEIIHVGINAVI